MSKTIEERKQGALAVERFNLPFTADDKSILQAAARAMYRRADQRMSILLDMIECRAGIIIGNPAERYISEAIEALQILELLHEDLIELQRKLDGERGD